MIESCWKHALAGVLTAATLGVASMAASTAHAADAVPYTEADQCGGCGMWITKYPGPKGQVHLKSGDFVKFCSTRCMTCNTLLLNQADVEAWLMQDAEKMDWSGHDADEPHLNAEAAWFVLGSSKKATMGPSLAPFATKEAAEAFQAEFGGKLLRFEDLSRGTLGCPNKRKKL